MDKVKGKMNELLKSKPPGFDEDPRSHHHVAKKLWKEMQEFLEYSAYSTLGNSGEMIYEKWPASLMIKDNRTAFYDFKDKIMKEEENYLRAQQIFVNQPLLTAFGNTIMARHAEDLYTCWLFGR